MSGYAQQRRLYSGLSGNHALIHQAVKRIFMVRPPVHFVIAAVAVVCLSVFTETPCQYYIQADVVNVRSSPEMDGSIIDINSVIVTVGQLHTVVVYLECARYRMVVRHVHLVYIHVVILVDGSDLVARL